MPPTRLAVRTKPGDLDGLPRDLEPGDARFVRDGLGNLGRIQFGDGAAFAANQELTGVLKTRVAAAHISVERLDAVNETALAQEIQRAIDRRRRRGAALLTQLIEKLVGPDRLVATPDHFENPAPQRGEAKPALPANLLGRLERIRDASPVVVPVRLKGR